MDESNLIMPFRDALKAVNRTERAESCQLMKHDWLCIPRCLYLC